LGLGKAHSSASPSCFGVVRLHLLCHGPLDALGGAELAVELVGALEVLPGEFLLAGFDQAPGPCVLGARCQGLRVRGIPAPSARFPMAMSCTHSASARRSTTRSGMGAWITFRSSGSMSPRSRAWVMRADMPLHALGSPGDPPMCGSSANPNRRGIVPTMELWFAVVPPPGAPVSFFAPPPSLGGVGSKDTKKGIKRPPRVLSRARRCGRKARRVCCRGTLRGKGYLANVVAMDVGAYVGRRGFGLEGAVGERDEAGQPHAEYGLQTPSGV